MEPDVATALADTVLDRTDGNHENDVDKTGVAAVESLDDRYPDQVNASTVTKPETASDDGSDFLRTSEVQKTSMNTPSTLVASAAADPSDLVGPQVSTATSGEHDSECREHSDSDTADPSSMPSNDVLELSPDIPQDIKAPTEKSSAAAQVTASADPPSRQSVLDDLVDALLPTQESADVKLPFNDTLLRVVYVSLVALMVVFVVLAILLWGQLEQVHVLALMLITALLGASVRWFEVEFRRLSVEALAELRSQPHKDTTATTKELDHAPGQHLVSALKEE